MSRKSFLKADLRLEISPVCYCTDQSGTADRSTERQLRYAYFACTESHACVCLCSDPCTCLQVAEVYVHALTSDVTPQSLASATPSPRVCRDIPAEPQFKLCASTYDLRVNAGYEPVSLATRSVTYTIGICPQVRKHEQLQSSRPQLVVKKTAHVTADATG